MSNRRADEDVSGSIRISDPFAVRDEVARLLCARHADFPLSKLHHAFDTFAALYSGGLEGYLGCDTWYHDVQHSLDCTLAMARLLDSHDRSAIPQRRLGADLSLVGVITALFHDSGYIRRSNEAHLSNGAMLTLTHVGRSAEFLAWYLPQIGYQHEAAVSAKFVHYTGYEYALEDIPVRGYKQRMLGNLLGTADIISQCSDRCYPEKCYTFLYRELELCGLAGKGGEGRPKPIYKSADDLIRMTPNFVQKLFDERLDGHFNGAYHLLAHELDADSNPYIDAIKAHLVYIKQLIPTGDFSQLRRHIRCTHGPRLKRMLDQRKAAAEKACAA